MNFCVSKEIAGRTFSIETGKIGRQANGSVLVRYGDTVVFVGVVDQELESPPDFFPLSVEYREKTSAAGKIPGGFIKREGRPTTKEILTMRLIDRPLRPLFPEGYANEVQITAFVLSADQDNDPDILAIVGASAALSISDIPFNDPIGSVRIGRINKKFVVNPTYQQMEESSLKLVITGFENAITMVEGEAQELPESVIIEALACGQEYIKEIIALQRELMTQMGIQPTPMPIPANDKAKVIEIIKEKYGKQICQGMLAGNKKQRRKALSTLWQQIKEEMLTESSPYSEEHLIQAYEIFKKQMIRQWLTEGKRLDGRGLQDIRTIQCEASLLPRTHGSALFTRGETQAMVNVTLGSSVDEQLVEGLGPQATQHFMVHYNFPPFSVGEVRPIRGPSRREIGHGALAERSLSAVLPDEKRFPYTIRIVSDIMESNGSSSMATVCGGTLAMMDAGIPIRKPVGGIAMGLIKENDQYYILSDITGTEDQFGDMDFKIAGTQHGITGIQMDIKVRGIPREILAQALEQARQGRISILREMMLALDRPRRELSPHAPRIMRVTVPLDKIATVIGPGGKTIRGMQDATGAKIEINDEGIVTIYSTQKEGVLKAKEMVEQLTEEIKVGKIYQGRVTSVKDFGAFVEIAPGLEGLVHVSELEKNYVQNVSDVVKIGDEIYVKVLAIDDQNRIKLSKRAAEKEAPRRSRN